MSMKASDAAILLLKQLGKGILIIAALLAVYWLVINFSWIIYQFTPKFERKAYGITWKADTRKAEDKAWKEHKRMAVFFLKKGDAASDLLKKKILPAKEFKPANYTFVMMLIEEPQPNKKGKIDTRMKALYDEWIQRYGDSEFGVVMVGDAQKNGGHKIIDKVKYTNQSVAQMLDQIAGGKFVAGKDLDAAPEYKGMGVIGEYWNKLFQKDAKGKKVKKGKKIKKGKKVVKPAAAGTAPAAASAAEAKAKVSPSAIWIRNYREAAEKAKQEQKPLLLFFTGSDWCPACIALEKQVVSKQEFADQLVTIAVPLMIDVPKTRVITPAEQQQIAELMQKYGVKAFPTFVMFDANGKELARSVGSPGKDLEGVLNWIRAAAKK